ncbi:MAG: hypothetical protein QF583_01555 [Rhodospirillales bacterium]|nr:hypothetical protein [Rhodospirillales bacterium]
MAARLAARSAAEDALLGELGGLGEALEEVLGGVPQLATQTPGPTGGTSKGLAAAATGANANRAAREDAAARDCLVECPHVIESLPFF